MSYVFAGEHPLMRIEGGVATYYMQDAMGSVLGLADGSGASVARFEYDSFGNVRSATGSQASAPADVGWDFRYHGMVLDEATGLYHVRARTYDARTGRFLTRDPVDGLLVNPETFAPYAFGNSNPLVFRDPLGKFNMVEIQAAVLSSMILARTFIMSPLGQRALNLLNNVAQTGAKVANVVVDKARPLFDVDTHRKARALHASRARGSAGCGRVE